MGVFRARRHHVQKKSLHASEQDRPDIARRREQWKKYQGRLDAKRLVFIDETWAQTNMTRRHGGCAPGTWLVAKVPQARGSDILPSPTSAAAPDSRVRSVSPGRAS